MSEENTHPTPSSQPLTATAQVAKDLMDLAKTDENTTVAARNVGESAVIISKTVKNCLLPLAAVNYAFDKARIYFEKIFAKDLEEKTQTIPSEKIIEPKPSIAGPALQGLAFCHEEVDLKEMYLHLLSSAMNSDKAEQNHPAFVEIIKQLTATEAQLLRLFIKNDVPEIIGRVIYKSEATREHIAGKKHILSLYIGEDPYYNDNIPSYIENWVRLGLIYVSYEAHLLPERYELLESRKEYIEDVSEAPQTYKKELQRGYLVRTPFGAQFAEIVGLTEKG